MMQSPDGLWIQLIYPYPFDAEKIKNRLLELSDKRVILHLTFSRSRILDGDAKKSIAPLADAINEIDSLALLAADEISGSVNVPDYAAWYDALYEFDTEVMENFSCKYEGIYITNFPQRVIPPPPKKLIGIDISHWQGNIVWSTANNKADFALIRATYGITLVDRKLQRNASRVQIPRSFYHFYRPHQDPIAQVDYFLEAIEGYDFDLPLVIDLEERLSTIRGLEGNRPAAFVQKAIARIANVSVVDNIKIFLEELVRRTGTKPMIYTSNSYWNSYLGAPSWGTDYYLWIASWTTNDVPWFPGPWNKWDFWQFTSDGDGSEYGVESSRIDLNRVNGDDLTVYDTEYDPPTGKPTFNLADYYRPPNNQEYGAIVMLELSQGGQDRTQLQYRNNTFYVTKGNNHEKRVVVGNNLELALDTSPGNDEYYITDGPDLPLVMEKDKIYSLTGTISFHRKSDCQPVPGKTYTETSEKRLSKHLATWTSASGITVADVIVIEWLVNGVVVEERWLAKGLGYVRWLGDGEESWIHEIIPVGNQHNNPVITPPCL